MNKGRKVLFLVQNDGYPHDTRVEKEAKTLMAAGYQVSVVCPRLRKKERLADTVEGVHVYRFPMARNKGGIIGYVLEYLYSVAAMFLLSLVVFFRRGFDVLHAHNPPDALFLIALFYKPLGKKFVFDQNDLVPELYLSRFGNEKSPIYKVLLWLEKMSCRFADVVIGVNQSCQELETSRDGVPLAKTFVVRNAPDLERIKALRLNGHGGVPKGPVLLGYIGYLGAQDGVDYLLRSVHHLAYGLGRQDFQCVIIGDGDALEELKSTARELKVEQFVKFTGRLPWPQAMKLLSTVDICVDPDPSSPLNERATMVKVLEYMALEKPIVSFDLLENRRSAQDAALYARANDEKEFAERLRQLMDDVELRKSMGALGKARVEAELNWDRSAASLLRAYERLFPLG